MTHPVLELRDVTKRFGSKRVPIWALAGVSLTLRAGETLGIVGESGSGKSTVARIAVGLETATSGRLLINGSEHRTGSTSGLAQMVFQDPASSLDPLIRIMPSVREPLDAEGSVRHNEGDRRAMASLAEVGLAHDAATRLPSQLSGGQKQRASIARALAALPPIIVCDEAVTALDVSIRAQILNLLRGVQEQHGISCMFISHDLCTVSFMSHRIAVMYLGKIVEIGGTEELFAAPAHPYTLALMSAIPALQQGARKRPHIRLQGDPPSVINPPKGCRFHTRCPLADDRCRAEEPSLRSIAPDHHAACHYAPLQESRVLEAMRSRGGGA